MSDDVLSRIDATLEATDESMIRNARRFDPLAGWQSYDLHGDGMRWRPARPAPPEAREAPKAASPFLAREDVTGGPDRTAEAMRAEVLRQGLTECEIDGQAWEYRAGEWKRVEALRPVCGNRLDSFFGDVRSCTGDPGHDEMHSDGTATWSHPDEFDRAMVTIALGRRPWWRRWLPW